MQNATSNQLATTVREGLPTPTPARHYFQFGGFSSGRFQNAKRTEPSVYADLHHIFLIGRRSKVRDFVRTSLIAL